jgi:hypothetical protein
LRDGQEVSSVRARFLAFEAWREDRLAEKIEALRGNDPSCASGPSAEFNESSFSEGSELDLDRAFASEFTVRGAKLGSVRPTVSGFGEGDDGSESCLRSVVWVNQTHLRGFYHVLAFGHLIGAGSAYGLKGTRFNPFG